MLANVATNSKAVVQKCSEKKAVRRNFAKFTEKHLCQGLFFDKVAGLRPATLLKVLSCKLYNNKYMLVST